MDAVNLSVFACRAGTEKSEEHADGKVAVPL